MPDITVWPVSLSTFTLKVGSSSLSLFIPLASWSWSPFETGSIETETTGSGNSIDSKVTSPFSDKVCPVLTSFRPITATISPAIQNEPFFKEPE